MLICALTFSKTLSKVSNLILFSLNFLICRMKGLDLNISWVPYTSINVFEVQTIEEFENSPYSGELRQYEIVLQFLEWTRADNMPTYTFVSRSKN